MAPEALALVHEERTETLDRRNHRTVLQPDSPVLEVESQAQKRQTLLKRTVGLKRSAQVKESRVLRVELKEWTAVQPAPAAGTASLRCHF